MCCFGSGSAQKTRKQDQVKKRQTIEVEVSPAHQKESRLITDRTNRKIRDQILNVSPQFVSARRPGEYCGRGQHSGSGMIGSETSYGSDP
jgi:hypothetical protein